MPRLSTRTTPVSVLALDGDGGGGVKPFIQLGILRALMHEILKQQTPQGGAVPESDSTAVDELRPSDYFDLIIGSGTGGILAIYLGRFRLTMKQVEEAYEELASGVYGRPWRNFGLGWWVAPGMKYDVRLLEDVIRRQITLYIPFEKDQKAEDVPFRELEIKQQEKELCRVAILATPTANTHSLRILRNYGTTTSYDALSPSCTVFQALRATSAGHGQFPAIEIGYESLMSSEMSGNANPAGRVREELLEAFGIEDDDRPMSPVSPSSPLESPKEYKPVASLKCLVSLGAGIPPFNSFTAASASPSFFLDFAKLLLVGEHPSGINVLRNLAQGTEFVHERLRKKDAWRGRYWRLNVPLEIGLEDGEEPETIGMKWSLKEKARIAEAVEKYLNLTETENSLEDMVPQLLA